MPTIYSATVTSMLPLLEGGPDPAKRSSLYQRWSSELHLTSEMHVEGVTSLLMPVTVNHYFQNEALFPLPGAMALCIGRFSIEVQDEVPRMEIWTMQLNP